MPQKNRKMDFRELDFDDMYDKCCGELFLTIKGAIIFHCTLCTLTCTGYEMFESHIRKEHLWTNEVFYNEDHTENDVEYANIERLGEYDYQDEEEQSDENQQENIQIQTDFSENGDEENLLEKLLDYNEKQEKREVRTATSETQALVNSQRETRSSVKRKSNTISAARVGTKSTSLQKNVEIALPDRFHELPSCDRPQLKKLRDLSSALTDKERVHKCPYCVFASKDKTNLWSHVQRHSNNKPHKCEYCPKSFHTRTEIIFHTRSHTGERPYLCDDCGRAFVTKQQLKQHIKRHKNERDFNCTECEKKFYSRQELGAHMTVHTGETPFKCNLCESVFTRRKALYAHRKLHENKKAYQCQICGMAYNQGSGLYMHMKREHKLIKNKVELVDEQTKDFKINVGKQKTTEKFSTENVQTNNLDIESDNCDFEVDLNENALSGSDNDVTFLQNTLKESSQETSLTISCPKCDRKYYNKKSLQMHLRRHHPGFKMLRSNAANSSTTCADCPGKTYSSLKALQRHRREKHSTETGNIFPCPNCEKQFQTRDRVSAHLRCVHKKGKNTRRYSCTQCERVFTERYQLKRHEIRHTGVRNFICPVTGCGQAFYDVKTLGAHKRLVHVEMKKFVCGICGFSTKTSHSLKTHIRTHTAEKPYKCDQCDKCFATTSAVSEHKVIHNSHIRPHICDVCGKSFARAKALYHHKPLHLGIKKFICKICGKAFAQQAGLSAHKRQHTLENFISLSH